MIGAAAFFIQLALAVASDPYVRTRAELCQGQSDQHCLWWPARSTVTFRQHMRGNPPTPDPTGTAVFDAVTRAWHTWQAILDDCGSLTIAEGPRTDDVTLGYDSSNPSANQNIVIFRQRACTVPDPVPANHTCALGTGDCGSAYDCWDNRPDVIALTTTTYDKCSGRIYDADIEFNSIGSGSSTNGFKFTLVDQPACQPFRPDYNCVAADIQNTATHEFGHALGLDHTAYPIFDPCDPGCFSSVGYTHSTMYAQAPVGDLCKRCVDSATRQFICEVYPKNKASVDCVTSKGGGCSTAPGMPMLALALLGLVTWARSQRRNRR